MNNSPFSTTYAEARGKFLEAATAAGATLHSYEHPEKGPDAGALFTDCAWIGPADAAKVLVLVSGTHGVEGFCGSGAQVDWLRRGEHALLGSDTAVLLIHAINPFGFAWKRRVTNENVDLNRNFVDFSAPLPQNPGYADVAEALKPLQWDSASQQASMSVLLGYASTHGFPAMAQVVSGGQYTHPDGLFFGGTGPTWSRNTLQQIFVDHLSKAREVGIIDYHTGLGPDGYAEPIVTSPAGSPEHLRALKWHGLATKCVDTGESVSADIAGDWVRVAPALLPHAEVTAIALEYGTVDSMVVLDALRADNWLHAHGDPSGPGSAAIQAQMFAAFYTDTDVWRGMVLGQSLMTVRHAINGLAGAPAGR